MNDRMVLAYGRFIIRWRWAVLTLTLALSILAAAGMRNSEFTANYRVWFGADNPEFASFTKFENTFASTDGITFVVQPKQGDIFTPSAIAALGRLTEHAWQIPYVTSVQSLTNIPYSYAAEDALTVENFFPEPQSTSLESIETKRGIALADPMMVKQLISQDSKTSAVQVFMAIPPERSTASLEVMQSAHAIADEIEASGNMRVGIIGMAAVQKGFFDTRSWDMYVLGPAMYAVFLVIVWLVLRSWTGTAGVMLITLLSPAFAMGIYSWFDIKLNALSSANFLITVTLALADSIHLALSMFHGMRSGLDKREALLESIRLNLRPVFFTTATTVISFLSLNFADAPPFHDLGNMVAIGSAAAFVLSMTLLPAFIMIVPVHSPKKRTFTFEPFMAWLAEFTIRRRVALLVFFALIIPVAAFSIPQLTLSDNTSEYFSPRMQLRQDIDFAEQALGTAYVMDMPLESLAPEGKIYDPRFLETLDRFAVWLRTQPEVSHVNVITDLLKRLNRNMHGDNPDWYILPESSEQAAQFLLLYEMNLPQGMDLNRQIDVDRHATRVTISLHDGTSQQVKALKLRAEQWIREHSGGVMASEGATGPAVMFAYIAERNIDNMLFGNMLTVGIILILLMCALRSVRYGAISLIPNLLPVVLALGIWAITVNEVGIAISVAIDACIGIIVDDNVHFLDKYLRARREKKMSSEDAVRYAFTGVGTEILCTSCIIMAGFSVLAFSPFQVNLQMNMLFLLIIGLGLVADFLFMSPLLLTLSKWKILP